MFRRVIGNRFTVLAETSGRPVTSQVDKLQKLGFQPQPGTHRHGYPKTTKYCR
jgi:hypothetical protein